MKEILEDIERWFREERNVALATVVAIAGSAPRELGAVMAINDCGEIAGSVSGGCVEAAVVEEAMAVLEEDEPRLVTYGVADELGFSIGLTCGGTIHIFVEHLVEDTVFHNFYRARQTQTPLALCTIVEGQGRGNKMIVKSDPKESIIGSLGNLELERVITKDARGMLAQGLTRIRRYGNKGEARQQDLAVFIQSFAPPPNLIIFGAIDFTKALCQVGKVLGYRVTVCDARSPFATSTRFPEADEVVVEWPHRYLSNAEINQRSVIIVLTHDPKFDIPALMAAVKTPAAYIGAMGSRRTHADRLRRLKEAGMDEADIARISSPVGLDIGAITPEETAVSIMAEVIALRSRRCGGRLTGGKQPIHTREGFL